MDKIFINNLKIETIIGCYDHELTAKQLIILDLELQIDAKHCARADNIQDTIDYEKVIDNIKTLSQQKNFKLLESYAEYITFNLLETFKTSWIKLKITKPNALNDTKDLGIIIERSTLDFDTKMPRNNSTSTPEQTPEPFY
jgi:dihydroneopterin aldolase